MKINNQTFMEVMQELAFKYGIELKLDGHASSTSEIKKQMLEANKITSKFYTDYLKTQDKALKYLENRKIKPETINEFLLGFAPKGYDDLYNFLVKDNKFKAEILEQAGLISQKSDGKGYIDKFRNRIIIPILDDKGNVVAFGGRIFEEENGPKYLNSKETQVYNKSKTLYGLYQAKEAIKEKDYAVIMEGYFDVITAQDNGIKNAVASCGTSLTLQHVRLLGKYTENKRIYLAFDADLAGQNAIKRGAELVKEEFSALGDIKQFDTSFANLNVKDDYACEIRVVSTFSGKDPNEFIKEKGAEAYLECIEKAPLLLDYQIQRIMNTDVNKLTPQEKLKITKELAPILAQINNRIIFEEYIGKIALELKLDKNSLYQEINVLKGNSIPLKKYQIKKSNVTISSNKEIMYQKNLLSLYFINEDKIPFAWLNEKLKETKFYDSNLIAIKQAIEEISSNELTVKGLIDKLMLHFSQNDDVKKDLADIIYSIDDKIPLIKSGLVEEYVIENTNRLRRHELSLIEKDLITKQESDENLAKEYQQKLKEYLEAR
jgi:DNA primase